MRRLAAERDATFDGIERHSVPNQVCDAGRGLGGEDAGRGPVDELVPRLQRVFEVLARRIVRADRRRDPPWA